MTKTLKKILSRGALGTGIGNIISMLVALVIGIAGKNPQMTIYDYAKYTCAATVIGFAFAAASLLFESERISLLKATGLHFLCLAAVFYPCALLAAGTLSSSGSWRSPLPYLRAFTCVCGWGSISA